ncbi:MAG: hypothetical protein JSW73_03230 [Candidatus Woesearchaeota archaeon]|nr:MAG: hypothetical protein JSW73_03230 [Candidatus Woesearchaeota archaeon]
MLENEHKLCYRHKNVRCNEKCAAYSTIGMSIDKGPLSEGTTHCIALFNENSIGDALKEINKTLEHKLGK